MNIAINSRIYSTIHLTTSLWRHGLGRCGEARLEAVRPGKSLPYRLLIVKRLSRHKSYIIVYIKIPVYGIKNMNNKQNFNMLKKTYTLYLTNPISQST